jgi:hypothetical protein
MLVDVLLHHVVLVSPTLLPQSLLVFLSKLLLAASIFVLNVIAACSSLFRARCPCAFLLVCSAFSRRCIPVSLDSTSDVIAGRLCMAAVSVLRAVVIAVRDVTNG